MLVTEIVTEAILPVKLVADAYKFFTSQCKTVDNRSMWQYMIVATTFRT